MHTSAKLQYKCWSLRVRAADAGTGLKTKSCSEGTSDDGRPTHTPSQLLFDISF